MDGGTDPQLRSVILSGRQHFISVQLTAAAGLDISLTDGEAGWRGSVSSSQLTHPLHMGVSEFRSRLVDGLLANGPSTASDELKLHTNVPHSRELEWRATMRQAGLEISLRQVCLRQLSVAPLRFPAMSRIRSIAMNSRPLFFKTSDLPAKASAGNQQNSRQPPWAEGGLNSPMRQDLCFLRFSASCTLFPLRQVVSYFDPAGESMVLRQGQLYSACASRSCLRWRGSPPTTRRARRSGGCSPV